MLANFDNNGAHLRYYRSAESKPKKLLYLTGGMMFLEAVQPFLETLEAAGFEVYCLEYRDHGGSSERNKEDPLTLDISTFGPYLEDLHSFITTHLKGEQFTMVGNSLGGNIALRYIQEYGNQRLKHLVLLAPMVDFLTPFPYMPRFFVPWFLKFLTWWKSPHAYLPGYGEKTPEQVISREKKPQQQALLQIHKDKIITRLTIGWGQAAHESIAKLRRLEDINVPVTVFLGRYEHIVDNDAALRVIGRAATHVTFHTFKDRRHNLLGYHLDEIGQYIANL